ncbi:unnamed protein product [Colias eurytheme]|nr:unnamed protein product [Colias eurytheme]
MIRSEQRVVVSVLTELVLVLGSSHAWCGAALRAGVARRIASANREFGRSLIVGSAACAERRRRAQARRAGSPAAAAGGTRQPAATAAAAARPLPAACVEPPARERPRRRPDASRTSALPCAAPARYPVRTSPLSGADIYNVLLDLISCSSFQLPLQYSFHLGEAF